MNKAEAKNQLEIFLLFKRLDSKMAHSLWTNSANIVRKAIRDKFAQDAGILLLSKVISSVLFFLQGIIVASMLGPKNYGIALLIIGVPNLFFKTVDARTSAAVVKYISKFQIENNANRVLAMCKLGYLVDFGIAIVTILIVFIMSAWAEENIVHEKGVAGLMILFSTVYAAKALEGTSMAVLSVIGRFRHVAITQVLSRIFGFAAVLGFVFMGWGVKGVVVGRMVEFTILGLGVSLWASLFIKRIWGKHWFTAKLRSIASYRKKIFRFLFYSELNELIGTITKEADIIILGAFAGATEAGFYGLAKRLVGNVDLIVGPLQTVLLPKLSKLWEEYNVTQICKQLKKYFLFVGLPAAVAIILALPVVSIIIENIVGKEFTPAIIVTQIFMLGAALWLMCFWMRPLYFAMSRVKALFVFAGIQSSIALIGYLIVAKQWGAVGMASVSVIIGAITLGMRLVYCIKLLNYYSKTIKK